MRINQFLASCGIASRRASEQIIAQGRVRVNGRVVTELSTQISDNDTVTIDNQLIAPNKHVYILMNKPRGYLTTCSDDRGRPTILDLLPKQFTGVENICGGVEDICGKTCSDTCGENIHHFRSKCPSKLTRVFPIGRLDYDTTGLLILTNDGEYSSFITHPSQKIRKVYVAKTSEVITNEQLDAIKQQTDFAKLINPREIEMHIHTGKNRQIRKTVASVGLTLTALERTAIGKLVLSELNLKPGEFKIVDKIQT